MDSPSKQIIFGIAGPVEDYDVFCDGRTMKLSEMRALIKADMERFAAMDAKKYELQRELQRARFEREEAELKALRKAQFAEHFRWKFEQWEEANQYGAQEEERAAIHAAQRRADDQAAMRRLMARIAEKQHARHQIETSCLDRLSDRDFIELKFALASKPSRRWLAPL